MRVQSDCNLFIIAKFRAPLDRDFELFSLEDYIIQICRFFETIRIVSRRNLCQVIE